MSRLLAVVMMSFVLNLATFAKEKPSTSVHLDREGERWAEKTLRKLTLEEKVGQLFMIWAHAEFLNVNSPEYLELREDIHKYHLGAFALTVREEGGFLYRNQPYEAAALLNRLQEDSALPLLVAADFERGVSMRLFGTTVFPHAMAFGAAGRLDHAEAFGRITAQEARAIGVHWNFFPVADVNSNPDNPIINTRSFGGDPQQVSDLVAAYIRGAHAGGMLTTAKHFPGHGDTATDSHLGVAQVTGDLQRLRSVELPPFRQAIEAGVDAVMVAHVTVPALEPDPARVASTSSAIIDGLLKQQLGFKGLVVTDALDMAGVTRLYANDIGRAAVEAFKAGNDQLLIPADLDASYRAILEATRKGEIPLRRVDESVLKILKLKASLGLQRHRLVNLDALPAEVGMPENVALGQQVADDAITLVRDNGKLLPLKQTGTVETGLPYQKVKEIHNHLVVVVFCDDVRLDVGRTLEREIQERVADAHVIYVDARLAAAIPDEVLKAVDEAQTVVSAIYVIPSAGKVTSAEGGLKNSVSLPAGSSALLQKILNRAAEKTAVLAMGNPYLAADFPAIQNYICAFSNVSVSDVAAVKALFGEIAIHGHLPVSIPGIAERGAGIERLPQATQGGSSHAHSKVTDR